MNVKNASWLKKSADIDFIKIAANYAMISFLDSFVSHLSPYLHLNEIWQTYFLKKKFIFFETSFTSERVFIV